MSRVITKKAYSEYFELVKSGQKTFDLRAADFEVEAGDVLELVEIDGDKNPTGRTLRKKVGTVAHTKELEGWYDPKAVAELGYVVVSLKDEYEKNRQIVDQHDNLLGCKVQRYVNYSTDTYRVSALWLTNSNNESLIAQRGLNKQNGGGLWGPAVTGTVEGVETYLENIVKETKEEIGLTDIDFVQGPKLYMNGARKHFTQYFYAIIDKPADEFLLEDAVNSVKWVNVDWLRSDVRSHPERYVPFMDTMLEEVAK